MQGEVDTCSKVFYSALSMGWINVLVQMVIPDATAIGVGYSEIVSTLALACLLQVTRFRPMWPAWINLTGIPMRRVYTTCLVV